MALGVMLLALAISFANPIFAGMRPGESGPQIPQEARTPAPVQSQAPVPVPPAAPQPAPPAPRLSVLACIRAIESGGDYSAVSSSGKYRGAYQFDSQTWRSVGGIGQPNLASPSEQDYRATLLLQSRGLQPWPPARHCH